MNDDQENFENDFSSKNQAADMTTLSDLQEFSQAIGEVLNNYMPRISPFIAFTVISLYRESIMERLRNNVFSQGAHGETDEQH